MQSECVSYVHKKITLTRANLMKLGEAFIRMDIDVCPEEYDDDLPSLNRTLWKMITSEKYVFSADFLARGYQFDRTAAEKMWRMICRPKETTEKDMAASIFRKNPNFGSVSGPWVNSPASGAVNQKKSIWVSGSDSM